MKNLIVKNKFYILGAFVGVLAGFLYWKYVGCISGTCSITANPLNSTIYFAIFGSLLFGIFSKPSVPTITKNNQ